MPKTKFQGIIFTLLMVVCMLYMMVSYNVALKQGGLSIQIFYIALLELPILIPITFIIDYFIIAKVVRKIVHSIPTTSKSPIAFVLCMSCFTILFMCPIMSGVATMLFQQNDTSLLSTWLNTTMMNYPAAFVVQLLLVGPFVRFIFTSIFRNQAKPSLA